MTITATETIGQILSDQGFQLPPSYRVYSRHQHILIPCQNKHLLFKYREEDGEMQLYLYMGHRPSRMCPELFNALMDNLQDEEATCHFHEATLRGA